MFHFSESSYNDIMLLIFCLLLASVVTKNLVGTATVWQNMLPIRSALHTHNPFYCKRGGSLLAKPRLWLPLSRHRAGVRHRVQPCGRRQGYVRFGWCGWLGEDVRSPPPGTQHHHLRGPPAPPVAASLLE